MTFSAHMLVGVVIITIATNQHLRLIYPNINTLFIQEPKDIKILKKNIMTWERTLRNSISPFSKDADMIRETLVKKVKGLKAELKQKLTRGVVETKRYKSTLEEMEKAYPIKKKGLLIKSVIALTFILVLFFVQSIPEIRKLSLGWSALLGVIFLLIISDRDDMDAILHRVEWPTLLFFAAMFVLMEAVERMGFIAWIGSGTENIIKGVSKDYRLAVAIIIILWVSALTSAFVESLPVTQMMVKIVVSIAGNAKLGLPMQPLIWALAFGPALGGNGTLVGASANVICAGIAEQHGYKMTFMDFFK
jgi:P protein